MRIGSPRNGSGESLIAGISALNGDLLVASGIVTIRNGSNVTISSPSAGVMVVNAELGALENAVSGKVNKPANNGSYGQVLATNADGTTRWIDKGTDTVTWEQVVDRTALVNALPSNVGSNGQFLWAVNGSVSWTAFDNTVRSNSYNAPTGSAVHAYVSAHASNVNIHVPLAGSSGHFLMKTLNGVEFHAVPQVMVENTLVSNGNPIAGSAIVDALDEKLTPPSKTGNSGKFLALDSDANYVWATVSSAGMAGSAMSAVNAVSAAHVPWDGIVGAPDFAGIASHVADSSRHVPATAGISDGKVLKTSDGSAYWGDDLVLDGASVLPEYTVANAGQILQVNDAGTGAEWVDKPVVAGAVSQDGTDAVAGSAVWSHVSAQVASIPRGDMTIASFVDGDGVVNSAVSAGHVAGSDVDGIVSYASSAVMAGRLSSTVKIGNADFDGTADVTVAGMGVASAVHSHSTDTWFTDALGEKITAPATAGNAGKVLALNSQADGYEWVSVQTAEEAESASHAGSAVWATSALRAIGDKNGNDITTAYQSRIDADHKLDGSLVSNAVASAVSAANVHDGKVTVSLNGTGIGSFTMNQNADSAINVDGVAMATDLAGYADGFSLGMDDSTYVVSMALKHGDTVLGNVQTIDLPLETMVVGASYDSATRTIRLSLRNGETTSFGVSDLVDGLVPNTRTVNGKALSTDIVLHGSDILDSAGGRNLNSIIAMHVSSSVIHVPGASTDNNGQVLKVDNGVPVWATDLTADGSAVLPSYGAGDANKVLRVNGTGTGTTWGTAGDMTIVDYVSANGTGVVRSAVNATTVNGHTVSASVPEDAVFTDTIPSSGVLTISGIGSSLGAFNANADVDSTIFIPRATSTVYGLAKVEMVLAGTPNAVANAVVSSVNDAIVAHIGSSVLHVPSGGVDGQVLKMVGGTPSWGTDLTADGSAVLPSYGSGDAGKVLKVNGLGDGTLWDYGNVGDMTMASFVEGNGVVKSAVQAGSLSDPITIGNAVVNAGSSVTLSDMGVASSVHSHFTSEIVSFAESVSSIVDEGISGNVHNAVISIAQNGVVKGTFSLNQDTGSTISLDAGGGGNVASEVTSDGETAVAGSAIYDELQRRVLYDEISYVAFTGSYNDLADKPTVDSAIDSTSVNPVQNRVVWSALGDIEALLSRI